MSATIGILMLDTQFERFLGDVGNPGTWPFPVRYAVVTGATAAAATNLQDDRLLDPFVTAGRALATEGVDGIATSCGFLALYQRELAARLLVPVATSALLQVPLIQAILPAGRRVGVLTFDAETLGSKHFKGVGAAPETPIAGLDPRSAFRADILGGRAADFATREAGVIEAALRLARAAPDLGAVVLECTNFAPHAAAIHRALGVPIYDIVTLVTWFQAGLRPRLRQS
jgi:Asp/Glu/hydantoin racemase